jgi:hypothetical protein
MPSMRPIAEVTGTELVWVQPSALKQAFELRAGDEVVATLGFKRSSLAEAETADRRWTFKREGFWHPQVTVRVAGSDQNLAAFHPAWTGGGRLELSDGQALHFSAANFWHTQWAWQTSDGKSPVAFHSKQGFLKSGALVELISPPEWRGNMAEGGEGDLSLLVVLGWYLLVLFARDAAASSAGGVAAAGGH